MNNIENTAASKKILRLRQVVEYTGLARSTIYDKLNKKSPRYDPTFPRPIQLGASARGFFEVELNVWIQNRALLRGV